jgi:FtsZ-binding cell division protein ZapB
MNEEINKLKLEIEELKNRNNELEEKLKSYTNPIRNKKYYEKNSDIVKEKAKNYMEKIKETNPTSSCPPNSSPATPAAAAGWDHPPASAPSSLTSPSSRTSRPPHPRRPSPRP